MKAHDFYELLEKQGFCCALTGAPLTPVNVSIIHKIPLRRGGLHQLANTQLIDSRIAKIAKELTYEELLDICRQIHLKSKMDKENV